jgi:RimJ/RimL family protein N-acetyltransferase
VATGSRSWPSRRPVPELTLPSPPLADDRVALRRFTRGDVGWVVDACRDPEIPRFTSVPDPYDEDDAGAWIATHDDGRAAGSGLHLAVVAADGGKPIGSVGLMRISWEHLRGEIGYWIAPWARGRGAAPRAVRLLAAHAFHGVGLQRIEVVPYLDNPASQRVAEKAGCRREGVMRSYFLAHGERHDCVMYALLPEDL